MQFLFSRNYIFYKPVHSFIIAAVIMLFIPHQGALAGWSPRTCRVSPVAPLAPYVGEKCICCTAAQNLTCCHFLLGQHAWGMIQLELFRAILSKSGSAEKGAPSNSNMALECFSSSYARKARCIIGTLLWPAGCLATCGAGWRRTFSMQKGATKTPLKILTALVAAIIIKWEWEESVSAFAFLSTVCQKHHQNDQKTRWE